MVTFTVRLPTGWSDVRRLIKRRYWRSFSWWRMRHYAMRAWLQVPIRKPLTFERFEARIAHGRNNEPWNTILKRDPCCYCQQGADMTVEHVVPRAPSRRGRNGGPAENKVGACRKCNGERSDQPLLHYLLRRRLRELKPIRNGRMPRSFRLGDVVRWKGAK